MGDAAEAITLLDAADARLAFAPDLLSEADRLDAYAARFHMEAAGRIEE
jgi:hypothetical protein